MVKKNTYENLRRRCGKPNHEAIEYTTNVQHWNVRGKANQQKTQAIRDRDQHQSPPPAQNSQARTGSQASGQRRQRGYTTYVIQRQII